MVEKNITETTEFEQVHSYLSKKIEMNTLDD